MTEPYVVAIVGRPNVGKSTLVNRILGRRQAIVQERPGITRDRVVYTAEWQGRDFLIVDSGGLESDPATPLARRVSDTARTAAAEADLVAMVVDVTAGVTSEDRDVATALRKLGKPVVLVANKADNPLREDLAADLFELGMGAPVAVSALHGRGVGDLLDLLTDEVAPSPPDEHEEPRVAIVGRPNVGKSSLFNRLAGAERSIVHDEPGTTRDAVDTVIEVDGDRYRFVDTAGMRKVVRVDDSTEYYGVVRAMQALQRCEVALLAIDATEGVARQDLRIAEHITELGRSAIVVLTKTDAMVHDALRLLQQDVRRRLPHLDFAPLVLTSSVTGAGVGAIFPALRKVLDARGVRVPTPLLNAAVEDLQARTPIPGRAHARIKYAVQAEAAPPTVVLFGSGRIPTAWLRHLERRLRAKFGFEGTPIRFVLRGASPRRGPGRPRDLDRPAARRRR